nr:MAG TPA: hypothetical protein [Caudoviricetes sp.]
MLRLALFAFRNKTKRFDQSTAFGRLALCSISQSQYRLILAKCRYGDERQTSICLLSPFLLFD